MAGRTLQLGDHVVFIDADGTRRAALVTQVWPTLTGGGKHPGCNLVYVSSESMRNDGFGRQVERLSTVLHISVVPSGAWGWCWPDEGAAVA